MIYDRKCPYCGTPILGYAQSCHPCLIAVVVPERERQKKEDSKDLLKGL